LAWKKKMICGFYKEKPKPKKKKKSAR
jgi:hypothetical protein